MIKFKDFLKNGFKTPMASEVKDGEILSIMNRPVKMYRGVVHGKFTYLGYEWKDIKGKGHYEEIPLYDEVERKNITRKHLEGEIKAEIVYADKHAK